jgi:hypothetical protein
MASLPISQVEFVVIPYIFSLCLGAFVAETPLAAAKPFGEDGSIKNNKLCKTNPISKNQKWL